MKIHLTLLLLSCLFHANAQNKLDEQLKQQLIKDWERAKSYTREYLNTMPADQYQFKAADSIRNFSQQMLHLAFGNVMMATAAASISDPGLKNVMRWQGLEKIPSLQNKDSVVHYVDVSYDFIITAIKNLNSKKYSEVVSQQTPGGYRTETRLTWLMKAFEHQTHHRGQCTIYIRLLGIHPPKEKLF